MIVMQGPPVLVNERVLWLGSGSGLPKAGVVKWIGHLSGIGPGWTVGLELDEALPIGGIDGTWGGRELFRCKPRHGLLVPISNIIPGGHLTQPSNTTGTEKRKNALEPRPGVKSARHRKPLPQPKPQPSVVVESKTLPRAAVRHKRRIPTPPPCSDTDEPPVPDPAEKTEPATLRVEDRSQEDSLKKRLRLFTENNGEVQRMNRHYSESVAQEVVIDSLYAQSRRQQFTRHGRSQSDSSHAFHSSASSPGSKRERDRNSIFSIFRWFRKENRSDDFDEFAPSAPPSPQLIRGYSSSCGSVDTLFSTATASSFAFVQPALYRPFGAANQPEKRIVAGPETDTYRNRLRHRDRVRELDKNLTLKKKYNLFASGTLHGSIDDISNRHYLLNKSLDSLHISDVPTQSKNSTLGRKKRKAPPPPLIEEVSLERNCTNSFENNKENEDNNLNIGITVPDVVLMRPTHRRTVSDTAQDRKSFVHVKGKRKAPPPPIGSVNIKESKSGDHEVLRTQSLGRKKRHAPPPPLEIVETEQNSEKFDARGCLNLEEKQRLIENIAKLQAHADRQSILLSSPPASPSLSNRMSNTVCNDTLKLEKGVLKANKTEIQSNTEMKPSTPTPVSPRPWYKRNMMSKEKSFEKKNDKYRVLDDWMPEVVIARGSMISQDNNSVSSNSSTNSSSFRLSSIFSRFDKPEEKRKSQISMLVNISELDREAAEIVQREQEREKAILAAQDAKYYTVEEPPETSTESPILEVINRENKASDNLESPRRTGARELISLFNSITNVTKITVNSALFPKESFNNVTKSSESKSGIKVSEQRISEEHISRINGIKTETVTVETAVISSPLNEVRLPQHHQSVSDSISLCCSGSKASSSNVVIEEVNNSETDKSRLQALYEANKIRKHLTPSPTIPTITEMSESITSLTTSPVSTLGTCGKPTGTAISVVSSTSTPAAPSTSGVKATVSEPTVISSQTVTQTKPAANYSIWSCPRCTLENPRWRVTCEACDMWRPAVRKDVIDKLTNANMGSTIAVNIVKAGEPKTTSAVKSLTSEVNTHNLASPSHTKNISKDSQINKTEEKIPKTNISSNDNILEGSLKKDSSRPITVSGLLANKSYKPKEPSFTGKEMLSNKAKRILSVGSSSAQKEISSQIASKSNQNQENNVSEESENSIKEIPHQQQPSTSKGDSELEEVRKARLAFFHKSQLDEKSNSDDFKNLAPKSSVNKAKIDALFSIASKGSLATNDEERQKVKEILKEMKNSLPKKSKQDSSGMGPSKGDKTEILKEDVQVATSSSSLSDAAKLGAIKKSTVHNFGSPNNHKKTRSDKSKEDNKAEVYLVKTETVIEEIKVKAKESSKNTKVSTSAQTNGILRKIESTSSTSAKNEDEGMAPVVKKPPTPKAVCREVVVPVTVEEHVIENGVVTTTTTNEQHKMGIKSFELIRPRDFASIEATKTGSEAKVPVVHFYANIPSTHNDDSEASSSSSSESQEITQLTAQLTKPKGLADFKASVLESAAGNKMNTLAVNRLLRQLEAAIAGGEHQRAATLAKQLAKHKVSCCVMRQKQADKITVNMYVEDKLSHQGPFPVQVSAAMTVAQLKAKVEKEFEIPATVQRWILGKELAADDEATLRQLGVDRPQCPIFLYLVAPEINQNRVVQSSPTQVDTAGAVGPEVPPAVAPPGRGWYFNEDNDQYSLCESEVTDQSSKDPSPEPPVEIPLAVPVVESASEEEVVVEVEGDDDDGEEEEMAAAVLAKPTPTTTNSTGTLTVGWKCSVCTLMNPPTRPGCLVCAADRPLDYRVPDGYEASGYERQRVLEEQQAQQTASDEKLKNYQELMVLENADLIPTTEPFECSVCLTECAAHDGITLRDCLHVFCRACLAHTVQFSEDAEVKCPFRDHSYACDSTLQEREIKALVTPELYEQHLAKSVAQAENKIGNAFHCKTPDCPGWCIFEDNVNTFQCPVCNHLNCLTCQAIHTGVDCKQYQEQAEKEAETNADARRTREMLEQMVERGEALPCPTCQVVLMKKWGCDWLRCSMCKTEICWVTRGPRWGPKVP